MGASLEGSFEQIKHFCFWDMCCSVCLEKNKIPPSLLVVVVDNPAP